MPWHSEQLFSNRRHQQPLLEGTVREGAPLRSHSRPRASCLCQHRVLRVPSLLDDLNDRNHSPVGRDSGGGWKGQERPFHGKCISLQPLKRKGGGTFTGGLWGLGAMAFLRMRANEQGLARSLKHMAAFLVFLSSVLLSFAPSLHPPPPALFPSFAIYLCLRNLPEAKNSDCAESFVVSTLVPALAFKSVSHPLPPTLAPRNSVIVSSGS